ncbi:MAG: phage holin family protein [Prevotella sp.]|nr:phage holin family protein [Prevotella sp.]
MLSSDKNVENIAQLVEVLKNYIGLQKEYVKLDVIDKVVKLVTALTIAIVSIILGVAVLFYLSFAIVHWLEPLTGLGLAYFLIAMLFLVLIILVCVYRKAWIERPLVRFLADTLLN